MKTKITRITEEAIAKAKLAEAAPDMLLALRAAKIQLEFAIDFGCGSGGEANALEIIDEAINKATL